MSDGDSCRLKYFEGEPEVLAEVRQMWDEIFDDPEEFADYYFTEICKQNKILLAYKGDVLAGMIASFVAQGVQPLTAAAGCVYLHGMAGDRCAQRLSKCAMLPSDMIEKLPELFLEIER